MKIECINEHLEQALSKVDKISGKNITLPILSGVYLEARQNSLTIKATNLDIGISIKIPVKVIEPGMVVVPSNIITTFISSLSKERNITLSNSGQVLGIKSSKTQTTINTLPSEEFPIIPEIDNDNLFSMPTRDFLHGVKSVVYSATVGGVKPELSSVLVKHEGDSLVFAATDSFRLAEKKVKVRKSPNFKQILIPQKNALEIVRVFDNNDEDLSISLSENQVAFQSRNIYLISRVIDGVFPDYRQIIPKEITSKAIILKQDLLNSLKTSMIFSDTFNQIAIKISPKGKNFEISSKNTTVGEVVYNLDAVLEGEEMSINVNHRYFSDCFQSITTDSVSLGFSGQARPIIVSGVGDTSFLYLVMPMNK